MQFSQKIYDIISINNNRNISLKSNTVDFENGMINAWKVVFKNIKFTGCYYHYTREITEYATSLKLTIIRY